MGNWVSNIDFNLEEEELQHLTPEQAAKVIKKAKYIVALTGAGVSKEVRCRDGPYFPRCFPRLYLLEIRRSTHLGGRGRKGVEVIAQCECSRPTQRSGGSGVDWCFIRF